MRILLIISQYKPAQNPNIIRWESLVKYFIGNGHKVSILTTGRRPLPLIEEIDTIKVHRAGHNTLKDWMYDLFRIKHRRHELGYKPNKASLLSRLLEYIIDQTWRRYYWPDGSQLFLNPGIKKAKQIIEDENIEQLISVGLPFTCHWIAYQLKLKNSKLRWHMDIQDPFCFSKEFRVNNFAKYEKKNIKAEKNAFDLADSISITNEKAKHIYTEYFPETANKIIITPPLFTLPPPVDEAEPALSPTIIHIGYFGSFYENIRSPENFLKFCKRLKKQSPELYARLKFHFIGQQNAYSSHFFEAFHQISKAFIFHGFVKRSQVFELMANMNFLINFGNSTNYHLPSKVVDYLYANKPIINLTSIDDDSCKYFFVNHPDIISLNLSDNDAELIRDKFLTFIMKERLPGPANILAVKKYATPSVGNLYLKTMLTVQETT